MAVDDPATGEQIAVVADHSPSDALAALAAVERAGPGWASTPPAGRASVLLRAGSLLRAREEELAAVITSEMGKPLDESRAEVAYAADFFEWYAQEAVRIGGRSALAPDGRSMIDVQRMPVGPCLLITPWNFPLAMPARKVAPALAAGNTVVVKPAEATPLSTLALADVLAEGGCPPDVVRVVTAQHPGPVVEPLLRDPRLRKVSFTGSTAVGRRLVAASADRLLRTSMELGGNAPFIVFDDADLDAALEGLLIAKMRNGGQTCTAVNRIYVARPYAERFAEALADRVRALRVGPGSEPGVDVGPLITAPARQRVASLVERAVHEGADVLTGAEVVPGPGYFYAPTVLWAPPRRSDVLQEEIFGPVASVRPFDTEEEVLAEANGTDAGLVAYIYTRDLARSRRVTGGLRFGMVAVNRGMVSNVAAPFGGVKQSGSGREGGPEGLDDYTDLRYVAHDAYQVST